MREERETIFNEWRGGKPKGGGDEGGVGGMR